MDPQLYVAAKNGNWDIIKQFQGQFHTQKTSENNTVLHILSQFCDSSFLAKQILEKSPDLLLKPNAHGETSLHIAARKGHSNVVQTLIECAKDSGKENHQSLLSIHNRNGNLALHEAVKYNRAQIIGIFVNEDPSLIHIPNYANESPLYLAVEKGHQKIASLMFPILDQEISNYYSFNNNDAKGWTPLHYAARINNHEMARNCLVGEKSMMAHVKSKSNGKTALHIATTYGFIRTIEEILSRCPDCWEMVTDEGKNVIHLAVENEQKQVLDFLLEKSWASNLINQKDANGNTPLHLCASTNNSLLDHPEADNNAFNDAGLTPLDIRRDKNLIKAEPENIDATHEIQTVISIEKETSEIPLADQNEIEKESQTVISIDKETSEISKADKNEIEEESTKYPTIFKTYMVVATLILTISFKYAFTIPGGYDKNDKNPTKGLAILAKQPAFKAFIVCDALSAILSLSAVVLLLAIPEGKTSLIQDKCEPFIGLAFIAILISFVTGLYVSIAIQAFRILLMVLLSLLIVLIQYYALVKM